MNLAAAVFSPAWASVNAVARLLARPHKFSKPVISVGNILAGGVGKTEIVCAIAKHLNARSLRTVIAMRGYGSEWERKSFVTSEYETAHSLKLPDESLVILKKAPGSTVCVGADRVGNLKRNWEQLHPDVILLDDGFQHFAIARDLDILVHDFSVSRQILRDFPFWLNRAKLRVSFSDVPKAFSKKEWVRVQYNLKEISNGAGQTHSLPKKALLACGLGNPKRVVHMLEKRGVEVVDYKFFNDHHNYTQHDVALLSQWRVKKGGYPLLTTLKDFVKLQDFAFSPDGFDPWWIKLDLEFLQNESLFWKTIDETVAIRPT